MVHILAEILIDDFTTFMDAFTAHGAEMRRKHGCLHSQVFRVSEEEDRLLLLFKWESRDRYEAFLSDPEVRKTIQSGGTRSAVKITYLEKAAEFSG